MRNFCWSWVGWSIQKNLKLLEMAGLTVKLQKKNLGSNWNFNAFGVFFLTYVSLLMRWLRIPLNLPMSRYKSGQIVMAGKGIWKAITSIKSKNNRICFYVIHVPNDLINFKNHRVCVHVLVSFSDRLITKKRRKCEDDHKNYSERNKSVRLNCSCSICLPKNLSFRYLV